MTAQLWRFVGYTAFTVLALLCSLYGTFPADALAQRLIYETTQRQADVWEISYEQASMFRLSGLRLQQVTLQHKSPVAGNLAASTDALLHIDRLQARLRLSPLLLGRLSLTGELRAQQSVLSATLTSQAQHFEADVEAEQVDLATPLLRAWVGDVALGGSLRGTLHVAATNKAAANLSSQLTLEALHSEVQLENCSVGPGRIAGFSVPQINLGQINMVNELRDGKLHLDSFRQLGSLPNFALQAKGQAVLRQPWQNSQLDVCFKVRGEPGFLNNNPPLKTALQLAETQLQKDAEGFLHVPLSGSFAAVQLEHHLCR